MLHWYHNTQYRQDVATSIPYLITPPIGSTSWAISAVDRHCHLSTILEQLGLDSHEVGEWVKLLGSDSR